MLTLNNLICAVVHQSPTEIHADGTFKVEWSTPHCQQLFKVHFDPTKLHNINNYFVVLLY